MKANFYAYTLKELQELFKSANLPPSGPSLLFKCHYKLQHQSPLGPKEGLAGISIAFVKEHLDFFLPQIIDIKKSTDGTEKFISKLHDGKLTESVLIPFQGKYTLCLSSQVGCAMGCTFCFTGEQGLSRSLTTDEIVGQLMAIIYERKKNQLSVGSITNLVFMGQGEPLHNVENVAKACEIFMTREGLCMADHKITVSTSGFLPGLLRWKELMPPVNIALSLHSPMDEKRNKLIPLNHRFPLNSIMPLLEAIPQGKKRFVTYEYLLAKGFNDSDEDAHQTGKLLQGKKAFINLIPFNPYPGARYARPEDSTVDRFKAVLKLYDLPVTVRKTKGDEVLAACGQLNVVYEKK